jgi:hypothetical protein
VVAVALQTSNELYMVDYLDANGHCQNPETLTQWYAKIHPFTSWFHASSVQ